VAEAHRRIAAGFRRDAIGSRPADPLLLWKTRARSGNRALSRQLALRAHRTLDVSGCPRRDNLRATVTAFGTGARREVRLEFGPERRASFASSSWFRT
jgi:hypothetical protein